MQFRPDFAFSRTRALCPRGTFRLPASGIRHHRIGRSVGFLDGGINRLHQTDVYQSAFDSSHFGFSGLKILLAIKSLSSVSALFTTIGISIFGGRRFLLAFYGVWVTGNMMMTIPLPLRMLFDQETETTPSSNINEINISKNYNQNKQHAGRKILL